MSALAQRLHLVRERVADACGAAGRTAADVQLIAVSKGHPVAALQEAYALGVRDFGESYVQEWRDKVGAMPADVRWHFVGHLQSNKAHEVAGEVACVHSVDRAKLVRAIGKRADRVQAVLLQVNVADEESKFGCPLDAAPALAARIATHKALRLDGLMTMAPYADDPTTVAWVFAALRELRGRLRAALPDAPLRALSMGMSRDLEVAIAEGATMVRVGTDIFGPRSYA